MEVMRSRGAEAPARRPGIGASLPGGVFGRASVNRPSFFAWKRIPSHPHGRRSTFPFLRSSRAGTDQSLRCGKLGEESRAEEPQELPECERSYHAP